MLSLKDICLQTIGKNISENVSIWLKKQINNGNITFKTCKIKYTQCGQCWGCGGYPGLGTMCNYWYKLYSIKHNLSCEKLKYIKVSVEKSFAQEPKNNILEFRHLLIYKYKHKLLNEGLKIILDKYWGGITLNSLEDDFIHECLLYR